MESKRILLKDLDPKLLRSITRDVYDYVTAFVVLFMADGKPTGRPHGSGTFIQVGDKFGVLTAYHLAHSQLFRESERIGLVIMNQNHHFSIPREYISIIDVGRPKSPQEGPDLSVVLLGGNALSRIQSIKSFWNLDRYRKVIARESYRADLGVYCLFGCPLELASDDEPAPGYSETKRIFGLGGFSGVEREWEKNDFDFVEFVASYDAESDSPESFEGVSGAGLWHILLRQEKGGPIEYERAMLCGVAYYQTARENDLRSIYCHGRKSVYENVFSVISSHGRSGSE